MLLFRELDRLLALGGTLQDLSHMHLQSSRSIHGAKPDLEGIYLMLPIDGLDLSDVSTDRNLVYSMDDNYNQALFRRMSAEP